MDQFTVEVTARLFAMETAIRHVGKIACVAARIGPEHAKTMAEHARAKLDAMTFPGNDDPVLADHMAAEIGRHVDRLLSGIAEDVAEAYRLAAQGGQQS